MIGRWAIEHVEDAAMIADLPLLCDAELCAIERSCASLSDSAPAATR